MPSSVSGSACPGSFATWLSDTRVKVTSVITNNPVFPLRLLEHVDVDYTFFG